jgi:hypothetical protein
MPSHDRKPKFRRDQVVGYLRLDGRTSFEKIEAIKEFDGEGFGYQFEGYYPDNWKDEDKLRPLTKREIGRRK